MAKWKTKSYKKKSMRERRKLKGTTGKELQTGSGYLCPHDELPCKRVGYDGHPECWTYNTNGHLMFVCKRFVAPAGFSLRKQLPLGTLEKTEDADSGFSDDFDVFERSGEF